MAGDIQIGAITDEFALDLPDALNTMQSCGLRGVELRVMWGKNVIDLDDEEIARARALIASHGMVVVSVASPLLKCVLPDGGALDHRIQHDVFGSQYSYDDQPRLTARALEIAERFEARILRVFSYWRTTAPERCRERVASALHDLAESARPRGIVIGLENEHACNVGTGREAAETLARVAHPSLGLIWDPANALVLGEAAFPNGYAALPFGRLLHIHAKDCDVAHFTPTWCRIGEGSVGWSEQLKALVRDGYRGWINLETHWRGPNGDRREASVFSASALQTLLDEASAAR